MSVAFSRVALLALSVTFLTPRAVSAAAGAVDLTPPRITHQPVFEAPMGVPLTLSATINDDSEVFEPALYYRQIGSKKFLNASMAGVGDLYSATIPDTVMKVGVEYFIEAYDAKGNGPARFASSSAPHAVKVIQLVVATLPPPGPKEAVIEVKRVERPLPVPGPGIEPLLVMAGPVTSAKKEADPEQPAPGSEAVSSLSLQATSPKHRGNWAHWTLVAGGVGIGAVGTGLIVSARSFNDDKAGMTISEAEKARGSAQTMLVAGWALAGVGAVVAATGGGLFLASVPPAEQAVSINVSARGLSLVLSGRF